MLPREIVAWVMASDCREAKNIGSLDRDEQLGCELDFRRSIGDEGLIG